MRDTRSITQRALRALLWALVPLAAVSAQDAASPDRAPYVLPFGLSCKKCLGYTPTAGCLDVSKVPILAVVSSAREVSALRNCDTVKDPHWGRVRHCSVFATFRFDKVEFLRNELQASAGDRYFGAYQSNDLIPDRKDGMFLHADKRYLILAGEVNRQARPEAEWYVARACELRDESAPQRRQ
jgi:hypothetical protein